MNIHYINDEDWSPLPTPSKAQWRRIQSRARRLGEQFGKTMELFAVRAVRGQQLGNNREGGK